jgi:hypothetical protein
MAEMMQNEDIPTPVYPKGPSEIPLDAVFRFIGLLRKYHQTSRFRKEAEEAGAFVVANPETVRFIKDFVAAHAEMRKDRLGARVIRPAAEDMVLHTLAAPPQQHQCTFK